MGWIDATKAIMVATLTERPEDFRSGTIRVRKDDTVREANADALLTSDRIEPGPLLQQGWPQRWQEAALRARHRSIAVRFVAQHIEASDLATLMARAWCPSASA